MNVSPSSPHWGWRGFRMQRGVWVSQKTNLSFLLLHSDPVDPVPSTASECFSFMFCLHAEAGTTGAAGVCFPASTESSLLGSLSPEVIPGYSCSISCEGAKCYRSRLCSHFKNSNRQSITAHTPVIFSPRQRILKPHILCPAGVMIQPEHVKPVMQVNAALGSSRHTGGVLRYQL